MQPNDFGYDTPPIDVHPVDNDETFELARARFDQSAVEAVDEVRGRLTLALAAVQRQGFHPGLGPAMGSAMLAPHAVDWVAWRAQRLRVELAAIEVWRNRRLAEWILAHHARWAGIRESRALQRVVARAYSDIGAFFDPEHATFTGVDPHTAVLAAARALGVGLVWVSRPAAAVH